MAANEIMGIGLYLCPWILTHSGLGQSQSPALYRVFEFLEDLMDDFENESDFSTLCICLRPPYRLLLGDYISNL